MTPALRYANGVISLDRPEKRNAISASMWAALADAVRAAEQDESCRTLIVAGAGDHFAAGADISEFETVYASRDSAAAYTHTMLDSLALLERCAKPTIAVIRGACVGGGCSIALACDFRFGATSARVGVTPGKLGLVYSADDTRRLVNAVGLSNAKRMLMTADIIDAETAFQYGFFDALCDDARVRDEADALAAKIAALSQWSIRATKRMFALLSDSGRAEAETLLLSSFENADFREGYKAFLEKRSPGFPTR